MDKYEYKVRADEIKSLIAEGNYEEAVKIADSIDWRRVKSVMMLCTVSDLYKINRRYEDSRDILLLAYERHTGGRLIVYSLCELSIKLEDYVAAMEYYKEFVQLAPKDTGRYILQYKLYEANEVSLEERIAVLEEFKQKDYREKWAYELAYLYHRVGLASKCVEECDEIVLWFGEGRYVFKALELKQLHTPLTEEQQEKYDRMKMGLYTESDYEAEQNAIREGAESETEEEEDEEFSLQENLLTDPTQEIPGKEIDIQVKTVDVSQYNTINLQKELAESMKEFLGEEESSKHPEKPLEEALTEELEQLPEEDTAEEAAKENSPQILQVSQDTDEMQPLTEEEIRRSEAESEQEKVSQEVFFGNTSEVNIEDVVSELVEKNTEKAYPGAYRSEQPAALVQERTPGSQAVERTAASAASPDSSISNTGVIKAFHKPSGYDDILSQEYDGQISLVVPEEEKIEKQITGQLSIEDIMAEWEKMKKENERRRMEEIRSRVHQQTNTLFADFDESTKSGLLEELEKVMVTAAMKEEKSKAASERPKVIKVSDIEAASAEKAASLKKEDTAEKEPDFTEETPAKEAEAEEDTVTKADVTKAGTAEAEEEKSEEETEAMETEAEETEAMETEAEAESDIEEAAEEDTADTQEAAEEKTAKKKTAKEAASAERDTESKYKARELTPSEREQFAPFIHHRKTRRQIVEAIDNISMASFIGNVVISGEEGTGTTALAKLLVKEIQLADSNFSGKVAKISGTTMNKKDVAATLSKLSGGALIIEGAAAMKKATVDALIKDLNQEGKGIIVLIEDSKEAIDGFLAKNTGLEAIFNLRVDVEALDDQTLVKYAKKYALEQEYAFDELGVLALHTRIADMQTSDHEVTLSEIEELVDEAIYYADRKTPKHFFDILFGKRYDEEDMIILREKDFMHY